MQAWNRWQLLWRNINSHNTLPRPHPSVPLSGSAFPASTHSRPQRHKKQQRKTGPSGATWLLDLVVSVVQAGSLAYVISHYLMTSSTMHGASMWPTFWPEGDVALVERVSHRWNRLVPGDVVVCTSPDDPTQTICKRLAALEGTRVRTPVMDGLFSNRFTQILGVQQYKWLVVPPGHVWLLGDNAEVSYDSRSYGPVPYALITGRVFAQVWPPSRASFISSSHLSTTAHGRASPG